MTSPMSIAYAQGPNPALFPLLLGRSGGQTLNGGTGASENLTLVSTANGTKGKILFGTSGYDEVNNRLGIANAAPSVPLDVTGVANFSTGFRIGGVAAAGNVPAGNGTNYVAHGLLNEIVVGNASYTVVAADVQGYADLVIRCDPVTVARTITLPSAALSNGCRITVWVNLSTGGTCIVSRAGSDVFLDHLGGAPTTVTLDSNFENITLRPNSGGLWIVTGKNYS